MKFLIYSDTHISQDSSIVRGLKDKYSIRLHYIIDSINWAERLAEENKCDYIVNLGDTFDKPVINAMEATAIQDINWSSIPHYILVGNHDSNVASLEYSSVEVLKKFNFNIIKEPTTMSFPTFNLLFLPYILEDNRKDLLEYWGTYDNTKKNIIFSHNDIAGFNFGKFISKEGFDINDIGNNCDLYFNGHLHNSSKIINKILNVGNLCGQNFSENAILYKHGVCILDTNTLEIDFHENPYALNFYSLTVTKSDIDKLDSYLTLPNSVIMIRCEAECINEVKNIIKNRNNIVASKILIYNTEVKQTSDLSMKISKIDPWTLLTDYLNNAFGDSEILRDELSHLCSK